jgi:hypothetical protein
MYPYPDLQSARAATKAALAVAVRTERQLRKERGICLFCREPAEIRPNGYPYARCAKHRQADRLEKNRRRRN